MSLGASESSGVYRPFHANSFAEDKPWANAPKANVWSDVWFDVWSDDVWTDELHAIAPWANVSVRACELSGVKRPVVDDISSFC